MMTGCFPSTTGAVTNHHAEVARQPGGNLPSCLRSTGYRTALIGKNHSHLGPDDFDYFLPFGHNGARRSAPDAVGNSRFEATEPAGAPAADGWIADLHHGVATEPAPFGPELSPPARIVTETCRWIDDGDDRPFFIWMSIPEPHNPFYAPEPYFSLFDPDSLPPVPAGRDQGARKGKSYRYLQELERRAIPDFEKLVPRYRANYYGMLRLIDDQIARLDEHLARAGHGKDTLIIATSDHGDYVGTYGLMRKGAGTSDSLMRVPFVASGAGVSAVGRSRAHVSLVDVFPTICEAVGLPIPAGVQGRSLWPILTQSGTGSSSDHEFESMIAEQGYGGLPLDPGENPDLETWSSGFAGILFHELGPYTQSGSSRVIWRGNWKLVVDGLGAGELYNLADDPAELLNRYDDRACVQVRAGLYAELAQRMVQFQPVNPDPHFPDHTGVELSLPEHNWWHPGKRE
jgi:arylsulfatase A-like enzyme